MEWIKQEKSFNVPIKSWCNTLEQGALDQAINLAKHPKIYNHVALMPDCHQGFGMPIGGVIACVDAVIPNAVGVDIGCGMAAVQTSIDAEKFVVENDMKQIRKLLNNVKKEIPVGEGRAHNKEQKWDEFSKYIDTKEFLPAWYTKKMWNLAKRNLGTLGGGNHFIELQEGDDGYIWLMLHSGSRNLGYVIAKYYNDLAVKDNSEKNISIPDKDLAFLDSNSKTGINYIQDMNFALEYAKQNRFLMMEKFQNVFYDFNSCEFQKQINIHHNYANLEKHFNKKVFIHRKGATSADKDEFGIIPGSMGTPSYIVKGLGNVDSFKSCSHGAGRRMGRLEASRKLEVNECDKAMEGIVCERWNKIRYGKQKGKYDLGEAPQAYKDIEEVISMQDDLVVPIVKLKPLGVVKG